MSTIAEGATTTGAARAVDATKTYGSGEAAARWPV
jgi:hypothetical protein